MKNKQAILNYKYEKAVLKYTKFFCKKMGFNFKDGYWIAGKIGEVFFIADYYFDFSDIKLVVDEAISFPTLIEWYDNELDKHNCINATDIKKPSINLQSWVEGVRDN